jgi:hypothetical protein
MIVVDVPKRVFRLHHRPVGRDKGDLAHEIVVFELEYVRVRAALMLRLW